MAEPFVTEIDIDAPIEEVFRHLTESSAMVDWMGQYATLEPAPGGRFEVDINGIPIRGSYLEVDAPHRVVVSWGAAGNDALPPGSSRVEFTLTATSAGTRLRLVHADLPDEEVAKHGIGWGHFLGRLAAAASGADAGPDPWGSN